MTLFCCQPVRARIILIIGNKILLNILYLLDELFFQTSQFNGNLIGKFFCKFNEIIFTATFLKALIFVKSLILYGQK